MTLRPPCMLVALLALAPAQDGDAPLGERERAVHLLSRLTFGPRPGDVERVLALGPEAWLEEQLDGPEERALDARLEPYASLGLRAREVFEAYVEPTPADASAAERARADRLRDTPRDELMRATLCRATYAEGQAAEVLFDFWRNHFNVSYTKGGPALQLLTAWDREVIRAHGLGRFDELLRASAHHPAMLHYLDNASSRRPPTDQELAEIERRVRRSTGSREAGRAAADLALQRGLNENYARELLELHTLGVDNFYQQDDVVALAEVLTGWTWSGGADGDWGYRFRQDLHVTGSKRFLQQRIQGEPEKGEQEGDEVLELLAAHRGTAQFVATKLVRLLVADDPPPRLVAAVARTFRKTDGDARAMVRTVVESQEFWSRAAWRAKFKTPLELVVSALRATGAEVTSWDAVLARLTAMGQPIYHCDDPTGWYDTAEAWLDPGVLALRWSFAADLAHERIAGVRLPPDVFADIGDDVPVGEWSDRLVARVVPGGVGPRTQFALDRAVAEDLLAEPDALRRRLLALLLGSPEFQRQ